MAKRALEAVQECYACSEASYIVKSRAGASFTKLTWDSNSLELDVAAPDAEGKAEEKLIVKATGF